MRRLAIAVVLLCVASAAGASTERLDVLDPAERCQACAGESSMPATRPAASRATAAATKPADDLEAAAVDVPAKSLVARQGLLVPAAFLAAASALSSTIVLGLRGRPARPAAAAAESATH